MYFYHFMFIKSVYVHVRVCGFDFKQHSLLEYPTRPKGMALQPQELR